METLFRAAILDFIANPAACKEYEESYRYFRDGLLVVSHEGKVLARGPWSELHRQYEGLEAVEYPGCLIMPGFIDCHLHYPQMEIIASHGAELLDWLERYTFPAECRFADLEHAQLIAKQFIAELLRNGTTTALVMATSHPQAVDSLFAEAERCNLRVYSGLMLMDRYAPEPLLRSSVEAYRASAELCERWHGRGRLGYAITPRFALTSSRENLAAAAELKRAFPTALIHTHLAENRAEIAAVGRLFPEARSYLDVYHRAGLTGPESVFAHSIYLAVDDLSCLKETGSRIVHCPSSNLFLGSGMFDYHAALAAGLIVGLGSDVGGGPSFSLLKTMADAYRVSCFSSRKLAPLQAFYAATLGGAVTLGAEQQIGNFTIGKEADFIVINPRVTPLQQLRLAGVSTLVEELFALLMLADDRNIVATYIKGRKS